MACASPSSFDSQNFECSVCNEVFTDPKVLPCGHLVCHTCVLRWIKKNPDAKCPLCRHVIVEPAQLASRSVEDLVNDFPTDKSLEVLCEAERVLARDHQCCVCDTVLATCMCLDCRDLFCQSCKKAHGKQSMSKKHIIEDLSSLTAETLAEKLISPCSTHPDEMPKVFCPNHGATICLLCASTSHRNCQDIQDLAEKMAESRRTLDKLITRLTEGETKLDKAIEQLEQHQKHTEKCLDDAVAQVEAMCDRLDAAVKENRRRMKELIEKARHKLREAVNEGKSVLSRRKSKLTTHKQVVDRSVRVKNRQAITSTSAKMGRRVDQLDFSVALPEDGAVICGVQFILDPAAVSSIEQQLAGLGEVRLDPAHLTAHGQVPTNQTGFCFHDNHGTSVRLSNNNKTATKTRDVWNGIVMSRDPLQVNTLYEVQIDQSHTTRGGGGYNNLCVGVVRQTPDSLTLPYWSGDLTQAVSVLCNAVKPFNSDIWVCNTVGSALRTVKANSRAGVSLDSARCLHVYVDGQDQGVAEHNIPDPCYAMFDVLGDIVQVTALPLTRLSR